MRRGACPSLAAPMPTGDGLLARLQPASGALSPAQLRGLAELAGAHGNGILEVTARGNLQIRGLTEASAVGLSHGVAALAIEPRSGVPIETSPLAGLDPSEHADAAPLATAVRRAVSAAGLEARLGPKVTVVVDGGGRIALDDLLADIRATAVHGPNGIAWQISLAGTAASARPVTVRRESDVPGAVVELLAAIAERGLRARGRDLLAGLPSVVGRAAVRAPARDAVVIGPIALKDGTQALAAGLAFGQIAAGDLALFAHRAQEAGARAISLAPQRRLLVLGLARQSLTLLEKAASEAGMTIRPDDPRLRIVACAGAPACGSAFFSTKLLAAALAPVIGSRGIHVSGCPKRCAEPTGRLPAIVGVSADEVELVRDGFARRIALSEAADTISAAAGSGGREKSPPPSPRRLFTATTPP